MIRKQTSFICIGICERNIDPLFKQTFFENLDKKQKTKTKWKENKNK